MGQYYLVCNVDRQEVLCPSQFDDGLKLMEFSASAHGTLSALAGLLAWDAQQRGPWAGCRLVIAGDYADNGRFVPPKFSEYNLNKLARGDDFDDLPAGLVVPVFKELCSEAKDQLKGLGISVDFRSRNGQGPVPAPLREDGPRFDEPEELLSAFGIEPCEDLARVMEAIFCELRVTGVRSSVAWESVLDSVLELDPETGLAVGWSVMCAPRNPPGARQVRTLSFPASPSDVRAWLGVEPFARPAGLPGPAATPLLP